MLCASWEVRRDEKIEAFVRELATEAVPRCSVVQCPQWHTERESEEHDERPLGQFCATQLAEKLRELVRLACLAGSA